MSTDDFRYDGSRELKLKNESTDAGDAKRQKSELVRKTSENIAKAMLLQEKLYAAGREGVIFAIQARDAAGKDSLIKHVFTGLNPQGVEVHSFKAPNAAELSHDYLWRINAALPARGKIGIFNRSQYEDVLVVKVHHLEKNYCLATRCVDGDFFQKRYKQLRHWEEYLYENGYRMIKLFLNVSKEEQKSRFLDRIERDDKHWKLSTADMKERALWSDYDDAYEDCINNTSSPHSPWYVLPADNKWFTRYLVSQILVDTLEDINPQFPPLSAEETAKIPDMMAALEAK